MQLPHYNSAAKKGEDGVSLVKSIVETELNWVFRKNHAEHDFGIDAFIDVLTDDSLATGKTLALQIKTGDSYFNEPVSNGWVYRDNIEHLNYYLNHDIPVMIVLVNNHIKKIYWCACEGHKTDKAGNSWKITVPSAQELSSESKTEILRFIQPVHDYTGQLERLWESNKILKDENTGKVVLMIDKDQIQLGKYSQIKDFIGRLESNPELILSTKGKLEILIDGYNDDSKELFEIDEVKQWMCLLFKNVNGLSYFLLKDDYSHFLSQVYYAWTNSRVIESADFIENGERQRVVEVVDKEQITDFLTQLFNDLNMFCRKNNIAPPVIEEISAEIIHYISSKNIYL